MRVIASLSALTIAALLGACTDAPDTSTETQDVLTGTNATTAWHANKNQPAEAWPTNTSPAITTMYAIFRKGPDSSNGATILGFVVWNDTVMGKIYICEVGTDCSDMRQSIANIGATRTYNSNPLLKYSFGSGGNGGGGTPPAPHPNVDDPIVFDNSGLGAIALDAAALHTSTENAIETPIPEAQ